MTLFLDLLGFISLFFGVYIGYKFAFVTYQYLLIKIPKNNVKHNLKIETLMTVDAVVMEKYNLGLFNLYPDISSIRDDYSIKELNQIYDFFDNMEELGIQFIYLKPINKDHLIYKAIRLRKDLFREGNIQLNEYK